ncbi:MAG: hypothetical protein WCI72_01740 [archaeon]
MEIKVLKEEKNLIEVEMDNLTVVELLRIYCNKEGAKVAAWKREHPTKNPILHVEGENPSKIIQKAIASVQKDLEKYSEEFKKMK